METTTTNLQGCHFSLLSHYKYQEPRRSPQLLITLIEPQQSALLPNTLMEPQQSAPPVQFM
ncbi:hypothetical protein DEO72_LG5g1048 [Vigna unguiculata]|uniref:Uncharacterized protein n=1 Tax=Vigna unguiculata TaxID=3917 RepID=A0A4D6LV93_VIGUN|nr:hypothetical protein DEO72_LG5g1048 [Vigna unguiculata]